MRFGLSGTGGGLEACGTVELLELVQLVDQWGFAGIWLNEEHFQTPIAGRGRLAYSPLMLACALAARTERIRIGFSVLLVPLHRPLRLAEEFATLDLISGGRADFGVSRGANERYFKAYGVSIQQGAEQFPATLEFLKQCWSDEPVQIDDLSIQVQPKPVQRPHPPIYYGAYSDESVRWTAQNGYRMILHGIQSLHNIVRCLRGFADHGGEVAQTPVGRFVYVGETDDIARREVWDTACAQANILRTNGITRRGNIITVEE
ncbi:MAG: LLM class flavin-dependent oxidoreductase [Chloroflexi bacterium]|nr:LLM class flavin-dependent oxidoreductase [Chloroflexota bacterium]